MGHPGRDKTIALLRARSYWLSMAKQVEDMVRKCSCCVCRKAKTTVAPLTPIVTSQPLELVCLDFLLVEPSSGYEHILVITDHFTKLARAIPTKNETALTTARALYNNFVTIYGIPQRIHSDQGRNFESNVIKSLCAITGMSKSKTTPYHPMGNGVTERMNQSLLKMLGTLSEDKKSKWKEHLPSIIHAYNCTPHEATGFSPYELMFGRKPVLPIDVEMMPETAVVPVTKFAEELQHHIKYAHEVANRNLGLKAAKAKERYDEKAVAANLQPGDTVLIRKTAIKGREKLSDKWIDDVHIVVSQPNPEIAVYTVKPISRPGRVQTLHRNLLLPVFHEVNHEVEPSAGRNKPNRKHVRNRKSAARSRSSDSSELSESSDSEFEIFVAPPRKCSSNNSNNSLQSQPASPSSSQSPPSLQSSPHPSPPPQPRRSGRIRREPDRYGEPVAH